MSITQPAGVTLTIAGLTNKVKAALQNNSNVSEAQPNPEMRPSAFIRDALRELTANYPFEELRKTGPLVTIGPGLGVGGSNYAYPVSMFLNPGDDVTLQEDPVIFLSPGQAQQSGASITTTGNVVGYSMDYLSPKAIQPLLFIPGGVPFKYTRYGNQFWFGSQPGQPYNVYLPYQVRHQFDSSLPQTLIKLPEDWWDILAYAAAERCAVANRWNDQATYLHNLLYGDPKSQGGGVEMGRPGLIAAKVFQQERDKGRSPVTVMPFAQRY
jgi:hypothetical protein